jgi:hypothetical protein
MQFLYVSFLLLVPKKKKILKYGMLGIVGNVRFVMCRVDNLVNSESGLDSTVL